MCLLQCSNHFVKAQYESSNVKVSKTFVTASFILSRSSKQLPLLQLGKQPKIPENKVLTVRRVRESFDTHHCQVFGYQDAIAYWCISLVQLLPTQVKAFHDELCQNLHNVLFVDCLTSQRKPSRCLCC